MFITTSQTTSNIQSQENNMKIEKKLSSARKIKALPHRQEDNDAL